MADKVTQAMERYWQQNATNATEKQRLFLNGLRESGTVLHAAELAGINRTTAYQWRKVNPDFRNEWDAILEDVTDKVEKSLYNQAISEKNVIATIFYLKNNRAKYRDKQPVDVNQLDREIEQRLLELNPQPVSSTSQTLTQTLAQPARTHSAKEIIASVLSDSSESR